MCIHIHIYQHSDSSNDKLELLIETVNRLERKVDMAKASFDELRTAFNAATNKMAAKLQKLIDQNNRTDMTEAEEAETEAGFRQLVSDLEVLASDPEVPVPPALA